MTSETDIYNFAAGGDGSRDTETQIVLRALLLEARADIEDGDFNDNGTADRYERACGWAMYGELKWEDWLN